MSTKLVALPAPPPHSPLSVRRAGHPKVEEIILDEFMNIKTLRNQLKDYNNSLKHSLKYFIKYLFCIIFGSIKREKISHFFKICFCHEESEF